MSSNFPKINLISGGTQGLINDMDIVRSIIEKKYDTNIYKSRQRNLHLPHIRLGKYLTNKLNSESQVNIFFEIIPSNWHKLAGKNILVPNQEWVRGDIIEKIGSCSEVWCKTKHALEIFSAKGFKSKHIGFTSQDYYSPSIKKDFSRFIHIPGRSDLKGTKTLVDVWKQNKNFPTLTILTSNPGLTSLTGNNIEIIDKFVSQAELVKLINSHGIHLCPSEAEGFGHYIAEAMSAACIVLTTNAPPMNEHVPIGLDLLINYNKEKEMSWGKRFFVDPEDIERKVHQILSLTDYQKIEIGIACRKSYLEHRNKFTTSILQELEYIV